jgi:hypothetical protein
MYKVTCCINQCRKSDDTFKDGNGNPYVCCKITQNICLSQRWCTEQQKYIVSERAVTICKNYK